VGRVRPVAFHVCTIGWGLLESRIVAVSCDFLCSMPLLHINCQYDICL
jgi:hypothetical protein